MIENIGAYSQADYNRGYNEGMSAAVEEIIEEVHSAEDSLLLEPVDCEDCAFNGGVSATLDYVIKMLKEKKNEQIKRD